MASNGIRVVPSPGGLTIVSKREITSHDIASLHLQLKQFNEVQKVFRLTRFMVGVKAKHRSMRQLAKQVAKAITLPELIPARLYIAALSRTIQQRTRLIGVVPLQAVDIQHLRDALCASIEDSLTYVETLQITDRYVVLVVVQSFGLQRESLESLCEQAHLIFQKVLHFGKSRTCSDPQAALLAQLETDFPS